MFHLSDSMINRYKRWLKTGVLALCLMTLSLGLSAAWWDSSSSNNRVSRLPAGNAITDGKALLRYSLPIDNQAIRQAQASLEDISEQLRNKRWSSITGDIAKADRILSDRQTELLASIPEDRQSQAQSLLSQMKDEIGLLRASVEAKDKDAVRQEQGKLLDLVGALEESMVSQFPFEVPEDYRNLPQLQGRATVAITTDKGTMNVVVDGYSAPVTAGNFVDLVQRGFYDGLKFIRAEDSYVLQVGDPPGPEEGFVDPATGQYRAVPLEVLVRGDDKPTYGVTLEDAGRYRDQPMLPFSAYGALAMARPGDDPNGGSSQFFFFLFEPELTPAGLNLLDGRYSVFGYVTEGEEVLRQLKQGDQINSAKVIQGTEHLVQPATA